MTLADQRQTEAMAVVLTSSANARLAMPWRRSFGRTASSEM